LQLITTLIPLSIALPALCTTQDVDIFIRHMNNARYLRELDFARFHFYGLTGIYGQIKKMRGGAVQGASSVRYRRSIPIFHPYKIETRLVWWDDKAIYLEQKFITVADGEWRLREGSGIPNFTWFLI
jgi:acyl-CoA thioesterase FadM